MNYGATLPTAERARKFMLAGNARVTLVSERTGQRFTYKISKPEERKGNVAYFVSLLSGPNNEADYRYLGLIRESVGGLRYEHGRNSKVSLDAPSEKAFAWTFRKVVNLGMMPEGLEVWHEGRCGRCARPLTVPESIDAGFGPECIHKV